LNFLAFVSLTKLQMSALEKQRRF